MPFKPWEIWLANYRFDDSPEVKKRPVLILDVRETPDSAEVLCVKMTGQPPRDRHEYTLTQWRDAGLNKETTIRTEHMKVLLSTDFIHKLGDMRPGDIAGFRKKKNSRYT
jgi:hypothetical protein